MKRDWGEKIYTTFSPNANASSHPSKEAKSAVWNAEWHHQEVYLSWGLKVDFSSTYGEITVSKNTASKRLRSSMSGTGNWDYGSLPGSAVPGILQARTLEWLAISFSKAWKWKVKVKSLSRVQLSDPMDWSLPGSSIHGIFQARVLEWAAIAFSDIYIYFTINHVEVNESLLQSDHLWLVLSLNSWICNVSVVCFL